MDPSHTWCCFLHIILTITCELSSILNPLLPEITEATAIVQGHKASDCRAESGLIWSWCFVRNNYRFNDRCAGCVSQGWAVCRVFVISCSPPRSLGCLAFTMPITWRRRWRVREEEQLSSGERPESEEPRFSAGVPVLS